MMFFARLTSLVFAAIAGGLTSSLLRTSKTVSTTSWKRDWRYYSNSHEFRAGAYFGLLTACTALFLALFIDTLLK